MARKEKGGDRREKRQARRKQNPELPKNDRDHYKITHTVPPHPCKSRGRRIPLNKEIDPLVRRHDSELAIEVTFRRVVDEIALTNPHEGRT